MFERGNADRRRARFGVRLLIALLVTALITLGCGSNATDERLVEDRNDVGAPEADDHPDPESARESLAASVLFPKRLGEADEIAQLAQTIVENDYINGECIRMDGGIRMQPR